MDCQLGYMPTAYVRICACCESDIPALPPALPKKLPGSSCSLESAFAEIHGHILRDMADFQNIAPKRGEEPRKMQNNRNFCGKNLVVAFCALFW